MRNEKIDFYESKEAFLSQFDLKKHKTMESHTNSESFAASKNWSDFINKMESGDTLKLEPIELKDLAATFEENQQTTVYDVAGSFVDVGVFLSGEPEHMIEFRDEPKSDKFIDLVIDNCEAGGINAKDIERRADIIASIIDSYENSGYRVRVHTFYAVKGKGRKVKCMVKVKDFSDHLQVDDLNVLHISFFRRAWFAWCEKVFNYNPPSGYGRIIGAKEFKSEIVEAVDNQKVHIIESLTHDRTLQRLIKSNSHDEIIKHISNLLPTD